jgi:DNA-binding response OmpR family regulator
MQGIIIASEPEDRDYLSYVMRHAGLAVARTAEVHHVESALTEHPVDIIVLVLDPQSAMTSTVTAIRAITHAPLMLLGERLGEGQQCSLLDAGADLILARPFSPRIVTRYINMLLKRAGTVPVSVLPSLEANGLAVDPGTRRAMTPDGALQQLTPLEFRLLYLLMTNQGQVISTDIIIDRVWGYSDTGNRELVRGLVRRLRRKIDPDPSRPRFIETIPGVGYRFLIA